MACDDCAIQAEMALCGDGLDLEVHADECKHEALEVLDQVVEAAQSLRVPVSCDM